LASSGRPRCTSPRWLGCNRASAATTLRTLATALEASVTAGDQRMAASGRLHLARSLQVVGRDDEAADALGANLEWYARAGGGDGAAESATLLAAIRAGHRGP
jgi:hypothetical protein